MRIAVVGVGKMGLSHLSILGAHPDVEVAAMCDSSRTVLEILEKYTGIPAVYNYDTLLDETPLDAVVIATPTHTHYAMAKKALERGLHVFCEKPLTLRAEESAELAQLAEKAGVHAQVGYHNRFVATFAETKRLLEDGAIGSVRHVQAEAYGPVVLRNKSTTWRSRKSDGGGCLYDYAAHPLDLLQWYLGDPSGVAGTVLSSIFSASIEDEVYATLFYEHGVSAQLSVNWSDESYRKMSTKLTLTGTTGRITVDRQECQVYLRDTARVPEGYNAGWNIRYTTELTDPAWFYVRGEEYSAELDYFVRAATGQRSAGIDVSMNTFASAAVTDRTMALLIHDSESPDRIVRDLPADPATSVAQSHVPGAATRGPRGRQRWAALRPSRRRRVA